MVEQPSIAAVIYCAKSTQDKRGSLPTQLQDCRRLAEREGWMVEGEFSDEAFSGWKGDRGPGLAAACEKAAHIAAEHGHCILVAQHSDRLARGDGKTARHLGELLFWAMKGNVQLRSVEDDSTFTSPLLAFAMGERNAEDSRRKATAVKAGMRRRAAERGRLAGGPRPYGFRWEGPKGDKRLVIVPAEARVVERIYSEYSDGRSQRAIERALNAEGVPTLKRHGEGWQQAQIAKILRNPIYCGKVGHGSEVFDGEHDEIVSEELWERVARILDVNARTKGHGGGRMAKGSHLFVRGLLRCGRCGSALIPRTDPLRRGGVRETYLCFGRRRDPESCTQAPIDRAAVDEAMLAQFVKFYVDLDATRARLEGKIAGDLATARDLRQQADRDQQRVRTELDRVERDYLAGELGAANYERLSARLVDELQAATAKAERFAAHERDLADARPIADAEAEVLRALDELRAEIIKGEVGETRDIRALRRLLAQMFERVVYRPRDVSAEFLRLEGYEDSVVPVADAFLEPHLRDTVIADYDELSRPVLKRIALPLETDNEGLTT